MLIILFSKKKKAYSLPYSKGTEFPNLDDRSRMEVYLRVISVLRFRMVSRVKGTDHILSLPSQPSA